MGRKLVYFTLLLSPCTLLAQEFQQVHYDELVLPLEHPFPSVDKTVPTSTLSPNISLPLSIVNMPVTLDITPKVLKHNSLTGLSSVYSAGVIVSQKGAYFSPHAELNADLALALQPLDGMTLALSQNQALQTDRFGIVSLGIKHDLVSSTKLGFSYDWQNFTFQTDLELEKQNYLEQVESTQYWRVGGEIRAKDGLYLRAGIHHDLEKSHDDIYYIGTGVSFGHSLNLDITGMYGDDKDFGGLLQTSYHF